MHDILIVTVDDVLLETFLNYPLLPYGQDRFENCRIWVVTDDRDRNLNFWSNKLKSKRQRPYPGVPAIQRVIDKARNAGVPVFPKAILGSRIIWHYSDFMVWHIAQQWNELDEVWSFLRQDFGRLCTS